MCVVVVLVVLRFRGPSFNAALSGTRCSVCNSAEVQEGTAGTYVCQGCGYDTEADYPKEVQVVLRQIEDLGIVLSVLQGASFEFNLLVRHQEIQKRDGLDPSLRYLDAAEQVQEAMEMLSRALDVHPCYGKALDALDGVPTLQQNLMGGHSQEASAAVAVIERVENILAPARAHLLQRFHECKEALPKAQLGVANRAQGDPRQSRGQHTD